MDFLHKSNLRPFLGTHGSLFGPQKSYKEPTLAPSLNPNTFDHPVVFKVAKQLYIEADSLYIEVDSLYIETDTSTKF